MSDLTASNKSNTAGFTLDSGSGKALSKARREALSRGGKAALGQIKAAPSVNTADSSRPAVKSPRNPPETISMPSVKDVVSVAEKNEPACGCMGADGKAEAERENAIDDICSIVADESGVVVGEIASAVRKLCQERRRALSSQGKKAVKAMSVKAAAGAGLTGRAAARARREDLCANGRGDDAACRPSGRVRPEVAANKVVFGTTLSGVTVSGSQLERNSKITGVEAGTCRAITGTEYIGAEQYGALCSSTPSPSPAKVGVGMTGRGQRVSGVETGRVDKVTGTELAANKTVTGNEYLGADRLEEKAASKLAPEKVGMSSTRSGINVSGTVVGRSVKVTGDEYGSCSAISGTEYTGSEQFESFCDAAQQAASRALMISRGAHAGTGSSIDAGNKVTGAERGESITLSGTPYSTTSQRVSQRGANNNPHPLTRDPASASRDTAPVKQSPVVQGAFSIVTPARTGQSSNANKISGTAYGAIGRITGPVNLATGLVSGTPEFRYQDGLAPIMSPVKSAQVAMGSARSRLTGDGREGGFEITGAAWRRNESITGTEGAFSQRNQTIRGELCNPMNGAAKLKEREPPELPVSKVTGSSGKDAKGSAITYSGGARG